MKITRIRRSARAPSRLTIEIDGARFASVPEEHVAELGLREGMPLGDATLARLKDVAEADLAYRRAVRLLAARGRSGQELLRRLRAKGHPPQAAAAAVGRLEAAGLINDQVFAVDFARARLERGYGGARIIRELLARGVDRRLAEHAVWQEESGLSPGRERLRRLARKRLRQLEGLPPVVQQRRLAGYLSRRGFHTGDVLDIVREVTAGGPDESTPDE